MPRGFGVRQRAALYVDAGGVCGLCGVELAAGWHADHVIPYSLGGETDVINGQALCPTCNLKKGAKVKGHEDTTIASNTARDFQRRCFEDYIMKQKKDYLLVATPGAGKTYTACSIARHHLDVTHQMRILVVVPTKPLCEQWAIEAALHGIQLLPDWDNGGSFEPSNYHGVVMTYAKVASCPEFHRMLTSKRPHFVIFDEIHHAGDPLSWATAIQSAFGNASARLCLSGTPFRSDANAIPFVTYENGRSKADYSYSYAEALMQKICRPVFFPSMEGTIEFMAGRTPISVDMNELETLPDKLSRQRLYASLQPGGFLDKMLREGAEKIDFIRSSEGEDPNAGGLVICMNKKHAEMTAKALHAITGEAPTVVTSDSSNAKDEITRFRNSQDKWIVAVKMVSEGVDIPRLRVLVFVTNIGTEMHFRQALGRILRGWNHAYMYIPQDPRYMAFARTITEERDHALDGVITPPSTPRKWPPDELDESGRPVLLQSNGKVGTVLHGEEEYSPEEIDAARYAAKAYGLDDIDPYKFTAAMRLLLDTGKAPIYRTSSTQPTTSGPNGSQWFKPEHFEIQIPDFQRSKCLRSKCEDLVRQIVPKSRGLTFEDVNKKLARDLKVKINDSTIEQLEERLDYLEKWLRDLNYGWSG